MATNFLNAVFAATQNFQSLNVKAGAFELAAKALSAGGKRFVNTPSVQEEISHGGESVASEPRRIEHAPVPAATQPAPVKAPDSEVQSSAPVEPQQVPKPQKAPPEWLKPKIFKSSNIS
jgi:hypothetical protein